MREFTRQRDSYINKLEKQQLYSQTLILELSLLVSIGKDSISYEEHYSKVCAVNNYSY